MTNPSIAFEQLLRQIALAAVAAGALLAGGCATEGTSSVGLYGDTYFYDDPWYYGGCCIDPPAEIGPPNPRPEHPIARPPPTRPTQPIASPPRPTPMPRAAARGGRR